MNDDPSSCSFGFGKISPSTVLSNDKKGKE